MSSYILPLTADEVTRRLLKVEDLSIHEAVQDGNEIKVVLTHFIEDGSEVKFKAPVDCSAITKLRVQYVNNEDKELSKLFAFADANGNDIGEVNNLFAANSIVKVILNLDNTIAEGVDGAAFVQNADTNLYLENRFTDLAELIETKVENATAIQIITWEEND